MYDLHNHILPGIDDGARNLSEALAMARQAVENGTTVLAATPHRYARGKEITAKIVTKHVAKLQKSLDKHKIPLRIVPGIELQMKPDVAYFLKEGSLIPLGGPGGKFALIEPPFDRVPHLGLHILESIIELGITPILAHPERNSEIQNHLAFVETCAALGAVIQLTAGSIIGKFGERPLICAKAIAKRRDWKIIIASDAHDKLDRTPSDMRQAMLTVAEWIGDHEAARVMVEDLPKSLVPW